jgi:hypothetical protein
LEDKAMPLSKYVRRAALFLAGSLAMLPALKAQTGQGAISGLVTDSTSAIVSGVKVTVRNPATGFTYSVATNEEGLYRVPYLNPGMYELTYDAQGFKRLVRSGIQVRSVEIARVDVTLEVGSVTESVVVTSEAQLLK